MVPLAGCVMADKVKVIMIDDEQDLCEFVKMNLEDTGKFQVITSSDGDIIESCGLR